MTHKYYYSVFYLFKLFKLELDYNFMEKYQLACMPFHVVHLWTI